MVAVDDARLDRLTRRLVGWLDREATTGRHEVIGCVRPAAGYSGETLLVELRRTDADGAHEERLAVKLPPPGAAIFPAYDFPLQARVQEAAAMAGIPTAVPARAELDPSWIGTPFLVMAAVDGDIFEEIPVLDRRLNDADPRHNAKVHTGYIDVLANIHRIDWNAFRLADVVPVRDNVAQLAYWREYLGWYADGLVVVPGLLDALAWCEAHRPVAEPEPSLLWGDVRLGNVIFDDDSARRVAVLDWEMATIGSAEHDLAWTLTPPGHPGRADRQDGSGLPRPRRVGRDGTRTDSDGRCGTSSGTRSSPWFAARRS